MQIHHVKRQWPGRLDCVLKTAPGLGTYLIPVACGTRLHAWRVTGLYNGVGCVSVADCSNVLIWHWHIDRFLAATRRTKHLQPPPPDLCDHLRQRLGPGCARIRGSGVCRFVAGVIYVCQNFSAVNHEFELYCRMVAR